MEQEKTKIIENPLNGVWNFWQSIKWYVLLIFFLVMVAIFYQKNIGKINLIIIVILFFIFLITVLVFNDNRGTVANALPFSNYPLPPHLGLDGVSNQIRFVN